MRILLLRTFLLMLSLFFVDNVHGQNIKRQTISSSGESVRKDGYSIKQTIGQPYATSTSKSNNISFRPGFQQPLFRVIPIQTEISLDIFPNPAAYIVNVSSKEVLSNITLRVLDNNGKLLFLKQFAEFTTYQLNCMDWAYGAYLISVSDAKEKICSHKLIIAH